MMRFVVCCTTLFVVSGVRLNRLLENDEPEVQVAVDQEFAFAHTAGAVDNLKEKKVEQVDGDSVTLKKGATGAVECENCRGDPSDMVKPFWRFSSIFHPHSGAEVKSFSVPASTHFWNAKETTQCMKDKYVLMLGDSTNVENLNDMILLLAGGPNKIDAAQFYQDVTHQPVGGVLKYNTDAGEMVNTYTAKNRNQTISFPGNNLLVHYRFTGAAKLTDNCGGLEVLLQDKVKEEINLMVKNGGRKPDAIILHSAFHDMCHNTLGQVGKPSSPLDAVMKSFKPPAQVPAQKMPQNIKIPAFRWPKLKDGESESEQSDEQTDGQSDKLNSFYGAIDRVGTELVKPWVEQGINVIWRGAYRFPGEKQDVEDPAQGEFRIPAKMDLRAKQVMESHGAKYVDIADLLANVHDESGCCSNIQATTKTFPHLGAVSVYHDPKAATFLSQLATFKVLDAICPAQ